MVPPPFAVCAPTAQFLRESLNYDCGAVRVFMLGAEYNGPPPTRARALDTNDCYSIPPQAGEYVLASDITDTLVSRTIEVN